MERKIVDRIFASRRINEASFEAGGSRYSAAFGRYSRDGESISREEYFDAKEKVAPQETTPEDSRADFDISSMSKVAGSTVKKGKEGPYYYDSGDMESFEKSVADVTKAFTEKYRDAKTVKTSKDQTVTYDEGSGYAIVVKGSTKAGKSWVQYKKLTDKDKEIIARATSDTDRSTEVDYKKSEDEDLVRLAKDGDTVAQETLVKNYTKLAYHLSKDLFLPGGDQDDLVQEALVGLVSAIDDYVPGKNKDFTQFAILAMKRNMQDAIRAANRQKHNPLNKAEDYETSMEMTPSSNTPEQQYDEKADKERLLNYMKDNLTPWEQKVVAYYLQGYSYDEIADKTGKDNKSINNAMTKVRSKLGKYRQMYKESKIVEMVLESIRTQSKERMLEAYNYLYK